MAFTLCINPATSSNQFAQIHLLISLRHPCAEQSRSMRSMPFFSRRDAETQRSLPIVLHFTLVNHVFALQALC